jgi:oxygen-independent coproporphyrinogen III oxidase
MDFYLSEFRVDGDTLLRAEGSPDTLDEAKLGDLRRLGFGILTYGIQGFDDSMLALANRRHTGRQARDVIRHARALGFTRVDGDLVWGLPGQGVGNFLEDVQVMVDLEFSTIVIMKLHLRSFREVTSAIGHDSRAAWEDEQARLRIAEAGHAWPSLGEQFQMREQATSLLGAAGYGEHPATYFPHRTAGPERWRVLNLDQDQQRPQVGIGLGGYTWSSRSEASMITTPGRYLKAVADGQVPFETVTRLSPEGRETRSVRMALSTCQPLSEDVHKRRFPGSSLMSGRWGSAFGALQRRGLARVDRAAGTVSLTREGATLVEAIINTEIS